MANGFVQHQVPMPGDRDDGAGQLARFDCGVQRGDDTAQPCGGYADRFRLGVGQRGGG